MNGDIINFIEAVKAVETAKRQLAIEEGELRLMREVLTKAFFTEGSDIPESFVIRYEGEVYLIRVDVDGDHAHKIERIGAIIEAEEPFKNERPEDSRPSLQRRIEKIKLAQDFLSDVIEDMDNDTETDESYELLTEGVKKVHKAYLRLKAQRWRQPLGVKE